MKNLLILSFILLLSACGGGDSSNDNGDQAPEIVEYEITVTPSIESAGHIWGSGTYDANEMVHLSYSLDEDYTFDGWFENGEVVSVEKDYQFEAERDRDLVAEFSSKGTEVHFDYEWNMETQKVTITNNNTMDSLFIWGTTTPLCNDCTNEIFLAYITLKAGEEVILDAGMPKYASWKPDVVYSNAKGESFKYHAEQAGAAFEYHSPIEIIDFNVLHTNQIIDFAEAYLIEDEAYDTVRGDCNGFTWLDRSNGFYQVNKNDLESEGVCFVGNIRSYDINGDMSYLPAITYMSADTSKKPE